MGLKLQKINTSKSQYEIVDADDIVVGTIKRTKTDFRGVYWYMYAETIGGVSETEIIPSRDNLTKLSSLGIAALRLYFVILRLWKLDGYRSSKITITNAGVNDCIKDAMDRENPGSGQRTSMSKKTFYTGINDLIRINFIRRVKKDKYQINGNYLFSGCISDMERW